MPIRPENKARYPKNWPEISARIRKRSKRRCECRGECGTNHPEEMAQAYGEEYAAYGRNWPERCCAKQYEPHHATGGKVVLTVAHLDHMPENCGDDNLKAMCQRCHNKYDAPMRRKGIKDRRFAAQELIQPKLI